MKRILIGILVCLPLLATAEFNEDDWRLVTDRDDIRVFMAHSDDSRVKTFRGVTIMEIDDFMALGPQIDDYEFIASWMHMVSSLVEVDRRGPLQRDLYVTTRLPWPVNDRDAPLRLNMYQDEETYSLHVDYEYDDDFVPVSADYVRMPEMRGNIIFEPLEQPNVQMTFEVVVDPGGYIPAWLANMILRDIPFFSMRRFRRVINSERYHDIEHDYYSLPAHWQARPQATE